MTSTVIKSADPVKAVAALREQRAKAITNCDFPKAKIIDDQIKQISAHVQNIGTTQQAIQNQVEYDKVKEVVRVEASRAYASALEDIYQIEATFEDRKSALISVQAEEIAAHAVDLARELELSSLRPVPDSLVLKSEAKTVAKIGDFDRAQTLFEGSTKTHEETVSARQKEVLEVYERLEKQMDDRHVGELKKYEAKKGRRTLDVKLKYDKTVDRLKKQLANAAFKYQAVRNEAEESELFQELHDDQELPVPQERISRSSSRSSSAGSVGSPGKSSPKNAVRSAPVVVVRTSPKGRVSPKTSPKS
jgi:protein-arginine kinase activator protein McsA